MKSLFLLTTVLFCTYVNGQTVKKHAENGKTAKEVLKLTINIKGGANAAGVAWHPGQKKYYAAQAGNEEFPMVVFDAKGNQLSDNTLTTMFDIRGIWYNPQTKTLQTNGYDDFGWGQYTIDEKGIPVSIRHLFTGRNQPDVHSAGAYDAKRNVVYFLNGAAIEQRNMKDAQVDTTIMLHLGAKDKTAIKDNDDKKYNYNSTSIIYTGIAGAEIGLLNYVDKKIELYSLANGLLTDEIKLPDDAPCNDLMNFSYCNGIYWLNDTKERVWHGYK